MVISLLGVGLGQKGYYSAHSSGKTALLCSISKPRAMRREPWAWISEQAAGGGFDSASLFCISLFCFEVFCPLFWKVHDVWFCGYFRLTAVFPVSSWGMLLTQQNCSSNRQEAVQARPEIKKQFLPWAPPPFTSPPMGTF